MQNYGRLKKYSRQINFEYEVEKNSTGMTGVAGIPMYMDLIERIGLGKIIEEKVKVREGTQGWTEFRYLAKFHDEEQEKSRREGKAFIPSSNEHLRGLSGINKYYAEVANSHEEQKVATLDMDATLAETYKSDSYYCYKGFRAYQPLNTWWFEHGMILHSEFRDGNVPVGYEQLRVFKEADVRKRISELSFVESR